eukprot:g14951.t1
MALVTTIIGDHCQCNMRAALGAGPVPTQCWQLTVCGRRVYSQGGDSRRFKPLLLYQSINITVTETSFSTVISFMPYTMMRSSTAIREDNYGKTQILDHHLKNKFMIEYVVETVALQVSRSY